MFNNNRRANKRIDVKNKNDRWLTDSQTNNEQEHDQGVNVNNNRRVNKRIDVRNKNNRWLTDSQTNNEQEHDQPRDNQFDGVEAQ